MVDNVPKAGKKEGWLGSPLLPLGLGVRNMNNEFDRLELGIGRDQGPKVRLLGDLI